MFSGALVERLTAEMYAELARKGPPEGFPAFPKINPQRYTSAEFYELEQEHLWRKSWLVAGRVEDLAEAGSYMLFDELDIPLIVVRGADGQIRCFSNTCRHRGAPIVREQSGTVRHLRCLYHAWSYDITDGRLLAVTDERDFVDLCKDDLGLPSISCDTWGGWVWINLDPDAVPLAEFLGAFADEMAQFQPEALRLIATDHRIIDCNWKVAVEAFQEVYHFRFIHDRDGDATLDPRATTMGLLEHGNSRMVAPRTPAALKMAGRTSFDDYRELPAKGRLPVIPTVHPIVNTTSYAFTVFPNLITPVGAIGFPILLFFPDGPGRVRLRIYHYAPATDSAPDMDAWKPRLDGFAKIIDEDVENLTPIFKAMASPLYDGVPLSYQERRIWHFNETIDQVIGTDRIPEELRVQQLLDRYIEK